MRRPAGISGLRDGEDVKNELILESLSEIPEAPAQRIERPSHNPLELPRSAKSHVPLCGSVTQSTRLRSPFLFRTFGLKHTSADWETIINITFFFGVFLERNIVGFDSEIRIALRRLSHSCWSAGR